MPYDLSEVVDDVKSQLDSNDAKKSSKIYSSIGLCLSDLADRLKSVAMVEDYTVSVAASSREVTLTGDSFDLESVYYLKWSTGDDQKPLYYRPPEYFLEEYDNPSEAADGPTYYTIILNDAGMPIIKFDCPTSKTDTLTVYYFKEALPENMARFRSKIAVIKGALAYFYGLDTEKGAIWYAAFKEAAMMARSSDSFVADEQPKMILSKVHRDIRDIVWSERDKRY